MRSDEVLVIRDYESLDGQRSTQELSSTESVARLCLDLARAVDPVLDLGIANGEYSFMLSTKSYRIHYIFSLPNGDVQLTERMVHDWKIQASGLNGVRLETEVDYEDMLTVSAIAKAQRVDVHLNVDQLDSLEGAFRAFRRQVERKKPDPSRKKDPAPLG
jgi:hypothetical protein